MFEKIRERVKNLLGGKAGHGYDHVERVYLLAVKICDEEKNADREVVLLAALLHDVDDYKFFGQENADNLTNAKAIMSDFGFDNYIKEQVCDVINNIGYSKSLKGIRPKTLEGQIVSDADMIDAIGMLGTLRTFMYSVVHKGKVFFDKDIFPLKELSEDVYKQKDRKSDNFVNHHFDKLLKLKNMIFTNAGKKEAEIRHSAMVSFLRELFRESDCPEWIEYLEEFERNNK